jgi:hypothetical protein
MSRFPVAVTKISAIGSASSSVLTSYPSIAAWSAQIGSIVGDDHPCSLAPQALGTSLAHVAVAADQRSLSGDHHVGAALDSIHQALATPVEVVELALGDAVVHVLFVAVGGFIHPTGYHLCVLGDRAAADQDSVEFLQIRVPWECAANRSLNWFIIEPGSSSYPQTQH